VAGGLATVATAGGQAVIDASESLDSELLDLIDKALAECANTARSNVMFKHFQGRGPTHEECNEEVGRDS
jgi:endonuclease I